MLLPVLVAHIMRRLFVSFFFLMIRRPPRSTRTDTSFPTRRSSDLVKTTNGWERTPSHISRNELAVADTRREEWRSEEHTSELQSLMRISYAVFCLKKKNKPNSSSQRHHKKRNI